MTFVVASSAARIFFASCCSSVLASFFFFGATPSSFGGTNCDTSRFAGTNGWFVGLACSTSVIGSVLKNTSGLTAFWLLDAAAANVASMVELAELAAGGGATTGGATAGGTVGAPMAFGAG